MTRSIIFSLFVLTLLGSSQEQAAAADKPNPKLTQASPAATAANVATSPGTKNSLTLLNETAIRIIRKHNLSQLKPNCLVFEILPKRVNNRDMINVREKHDSTCSGDPNTSPKLFSLQIDSTTGDVWSDANSLTGEFEKLKK